MYCQGMDTTFTPAASAAVAQPPMGAAAVRSQPVADRGVARANLFADLPAWAQSDEAVALLETIAAERPERTKPLTELATGATASFGYCGKAANQLRQLFDPFIMDRIGWAHKAGFDTPLFHKRRAAVFAYIDVNGPDALICRVLKAAS
jgi:hypothetical protein